MKRSTTLLLKSLYLNSASPVYLSGETALYNHLREHHPGARISRDDIRDFLAAQTVHALHKPVKRKFPRLPIRSNYVDALWMADLVDMTKHSRSNDTHRWILTVIDTFSRFAFAQPLRTKKADDVLHALDKLFRESKRVPEALVTDDGNEFFNTKCQDYLRERGVTHYSTSSIFKASTVERFNRTLKTHLYKHFTKEKGRHGRQSCHSWSITTTGENIGLPVMLQKT